MVKSSRRSKGTNKAHYGIYITEACEAWLAKFTFTPSMSGCVTTLAQWGFQQIRRGLITAFGKFTPQERAWILRCLNGYQLIEDAVNPLAIRMEEWLLYGLGQSLDLKVDKREEFLGKLTDLTPQESMGFIAWGLSYYLKGVNLTPEQYAYEERMLF